MQLQAVAIRALTDTRLQFDQPREQSNLVQKQFRMKEARECHKNEFSDGQFFLPISRSIWMIFFQPITWNRSC